MLLAFISSRQSAGDALAVVEECQVGSQGFVVCQLFQLFALNLGIDKECTDMNRPISSSHLSRVYSGGSFVPPSAS